MYLRIKDIVKERNMTIKELAEKMGVNRVNLSNMINGNPTVETLNKIADALNVNITDLFEQPDKDYISCPYCGGRIKIGKEEETH